MAMTLRARVWIPGCAVLFTTWAACQSESTPPSMQATQPGPMVPGQMTPTGPVATAPQALADPQAAANEAADAFATVFESFALSANGNAGVEGAIGKMASGFGTMAASFGGALGGGGDDSGGGTTPKIRERSALSRALMRVPAFRAVARPLATESMFGPGPIGALAATEGTSEIGSDIDETGKLVRRLLKERIFAPANLETKTATEAVYLLKADPTCRDLDSNEIDPSCAEDLGKLAVRVRLTKVPGASFEVLIGAEKARPVQLIVEAHRMALDIFLADVKKTAAILKTTLGEEDTTPDVLKGTVRFALTKEAAKKVSFATSITEKVEIEQKAAAGKEPMIVRSAASEGIFKITIDGDAGSITGGINFGASEVFAPWNVKENAPANTDLHVATAGLTGDLTFTEATDAVKLHRLGFGAGPASVDVRGQRIFQIDVNEKDGRTFNLDVTFDGDKPKMAFSPKLDLAIMVKLMAIAADFKDPPPAHLADETYKLVIDGSAPALAPWKAADGKQEGIKVVSGQLGISSTKQASSVTVPTGQCLVSGEAADGQNPIVGSFRAIACQ